MFIESYTQDELCRNYCSLTSKLVTQTSAGQEYSKQGHPRNSPSLLGAWLTLPFSVSPGLEIWPQDIGLLPLAKG